MNKLLTLMLLAVSAVVVAGCTPTTQPQEEVNPEIPAEAAPAPEAIPAEEVPAPEAIPAEEVPAPEAIPAEEAPAPEAMPAEEPTVEVQAEAAAQ